MTSQNDNVLKITGPWTTKSDGMLSVLFNFDNLQAQEFTNNLGNKIGGLRAYRVTGLKKGAIGASEWHKVRTELVFVTRGSLTWTNVAPDGSESKTRLDPTTQGIMVQPNILHTYQANEDDTEILVITNTSFNPDDPSTHDTYPGDAFRTM